ncbi:hypothetical protein F5146DRAFT_1005729 [Armillaria mellea]|nr:hypothetical protein F5146DRAFT_1005729 [Armillaria mellea]
MLFSFFLFSLLAFVCSAPTSDATDPLAGVVSHINVNLTASIETDVFTLLDSLITNLTNLSFTVSNPLIIEITLDCVAISAGVSGIEFISFTHTFEDPVIVPILGMADSSLIENVALTQDHKAQMINKALSCSMARKAAIVGDEQVQESLADPLEQLKYSSRLLFVTMKGIDTIAAVRVVVAEIPVEYG